MSRPVRQQGAHPLPTIAFVDIWLAIRGSMPVQPPRGVIHGWLDVRHVLLQALRTLHPGLHNEPEFRIGPRTACATARTVNVLLIDAHVILRSHPTLVA